MLKKLASLILCLVFLTTASAAFAEDVYVTKQGTKYHKQDCRFIKNRDTQAIDIENAKAKGLEPCGRCFGEEEAIDKQVKQEKTEGMVYATKNGKKYHQPGCSLIKNKETAGMSVTEAEAKGLTPCGKCVLKQQAKAE
ncbi:MAG: hypothetical protein PHI86_05210 [Candidatus Omnitrophica bacterium]|nr:hypothetical protein [Candidatus Omnitrophota bacterium]HOX54039.1 hypothetical protein [Candidatus Omnitrophota bacterium]